MKLRSGVTWCLQQRLIGEKTITVKSEGLEKSCVLVCLAVKDNGTKLKPMIVFKVEVRVCKVL